MLGIEALNAFASQSVTVIDQRPAAVSWVYYYYYYPIWNLQLNLAGEPAGGSTTYADIFLFDEVTEIINYETTNLTVTFTINTPFASSLDFGDTNLTVTQVGNVYTVTGFQTPEDWFDLIPIWELPNSYTTHDIFYMDAAVSYYMEEYNFLVQSVVRIYDPLYFYDALFSVNTTMVADNVRVKRSSIDIASESIFYILPVYEVIDMDSETTIDIDNYRVRFATDSETLASEFTSFNRGTRFRHLKDNVFNPDLDIMNLGSYNLALNQRARNRYFNSAIDAEFVSTTDARKLKSMIETYSSEFVSDITANAIFDPGSDIVVSTSTYAKSNAIFDPESDIVVSTSLWAQPDRIYNTNNATLGGSVTLTAAPSDIMELQVNTTIGETFYFETTDAGASVYIDWGDGSITETQNTESTKLHTHTYNMSDTNTRIKIYAGVSSTQAKFRCNDLMLKQVIRWDIPFQNIRFHIPYTGTFYTPYNGAAINLENVPPTLNPATTDLSGMFERCTGFNPFYLDYYSISLWDTVNVTNMSEMFYGASEFNHPLLNNWNVSNVTNMSRMFSETKFNQPLDTWNISNVNDMSSMFRYSPFQQPLDTWNVSNVTNMSGMFANAGFNQPLNTWDVSKVTDMSRMFSYNTNFSQNLSTWDVSKVTDMSRMFQRNTFDHSISTWNVSNVTDMSGMFDTAFLSSNLSSWNTGNVTDMNGMFEYSEGSLTGIGSWNVSNVTNMESMFEWGVYNTNDKPPIPSLASWDVSKVTDMSRMFYWVSSSSSLGISGWNVGNVTTMESMFRRSSVNQGIEGWDVSKVTDMRSMFEWNKSFNRDISVWDVGAVVMYGNFALETSTDWLDIHKPNFT